MKILKWYRNILSVLCAYVFMPVFFLIGKDVDIPVNSKNSARVIARKLEEGGIIHFQRPFRILAKLLRVDRRLKAGLYRMNARMSLWEVVTTLSEGKSELLTLKVPEGYTAEQVGQELEKMKVLMTDDFLKAAQDSVLLQKLGIQGRSLEGFLFPETYRVPLGASPQELLELMARQFFEETGDDFEAACRKHGLTEYQVVILASIVEKEAQKAEERPIIAGVLYNRLHQKMRLEVNATLNYVMSDKRAWLTNEQINTESPYNTYRHRGLPPTPICNPGLDSIHAVLEPEEVT